MCVNPHAFRRSERLEVVLPARCRSRTGFLDRGTISDLSAEGCRFESFALTLHAGDLVVINPEGIEGICGKVRWVKGHSAGIEFERPLYAPVVDHLHRRHGTFLAPLTSVTQQEYRLAA